jgi:hypothetical protein
MSVDRTVIYALVVGAILIVAFFALWRGTGNDIAAPNAPSATSTGAGSGTGGTGTNSGRDTDKAPSGTQQTPTTK